MTNVKQEEATAGRYHLSLKTKSYEICEANLRPCPLAGNGHYLTEEEAQEALRLMVGGQESATLVSESSPEVASAADNSAEKTDGANGDTFEIDSDTKFHLIRAKRAMSACTISGCPIDDANHFDSRAEASEALRNLLDEKESQELRKDAAMQEFLSSGTPEAAAYIEANEEYEKAADQRRRQREWLKTRVDDDESYKFSREWLVRTQQTRLSYYRELALMKRRDELLPEHIVKMEEERQAQYNLDKSAERLLASLTKTSFNPNPKITKNGEKSVSEVLSAWSGLTVEEVKEAAATRMEARKEKIHEAYQALWRELPVRSDKTLVSIDLETAAPITGGVDMGPYSTIIEVGIVKRFPDGTFERKQRLYGVPDDLLEHSGTGAEDIHRITPEMVAGMKPLVSDRDAMAELIGEIRGSVLVAHNATFEKGQLSHSVPGFGEALRDGKIEVLDTMRVCKYFITTSTNTNKDFVEGTGGEYNGGHRAANDAAMTLNALMRHRGIPEHDLTDIDE